MKNIVNPIVVLMAIFVGIQGCGGGSSSSSSGENLIDTSSSSSKEPPTSSPSESSSSLAINPLSDLGLTKGDSVCFRLKAYNNVTESNYSKPICGQINNDHSLTLSWDNVSENVIGYYVYYGTNKNNAKNFIADVIES